MYIKIFNIYLLLSNLGAAYDATGQGGGAIYTGYGAVGASDSKQGPDYYKNYKFKKCKLGMVNKTNKWS